MDESGGDLASIVLWAVKHATQSVILWDSDMKDSSLVELDVKDK